MRQSALISIDWLILKGEQLWLAHLNWTKFENWVYLKTQEFFLLAYFEQVFYEIFFVWKSLFHFFVLVVYYNFLQE